MSGIIAASASKVMVSGDTAVDNTTSGFITLEEITLATTGNPTSYEWGIARPYSSTSACLLSSSTGASPSFTPDVEGYYTVVCVVDGVTTYVLRIAVLSVASISTLTTLRFLPVADSQVPTPATGVTVYYSSTQSALVEKKTDGTVHTVTIS